MEGWDCETDGRPSENTKRRWQRFGQSGAKLIWGGEACAVRPDGRANPKQLMIAEHTLAGIAELREGLVKAHVAATGDDRGLVVGLQLTHSGRFCKPNDNRKFESIIAYHHPMLDRKFGVPADRAPISDDEIKRLIEDYVIAAKRAQAVRLRLRRHQALPRLSRPRVPERHHAARPLRRQPGESHALPARDRRGHPRRGARAAHRRAPQRLRHRAVQARSGALRAGRARPRHSGGLSDALRLRLRRRSARTRCEYDLTEPKALFEILRGLDIRFVNVSIASPYYNPHYIRPALYPPSDGYHPPEDPFVGVMRHIEVVRELKQAFPDFCLMGSGYTYLQEFFPNVAQAVVRQGWADFVGLGRMVLAYPELPLDMLNGRGVQKKRLCRTFSDCTTAPRNGLVSGCYPLDPHYKKSPGVQAARRRQEAGRERLTHARADFVALRDPRNTTRRNLLARADHVAATAWHRQAAWAREGFVLAGLRECRVRLDFRKFESDPALPARTRRRPTHEP